MTLFDAFGMALGSIVVNKLRSALTMLGVIIGVASVIAMVAVGNGTSSQVQGAILSLGSNLITVTPGQLTTQGLAGAGPQAQTLTLDDMTAIQQQLDGMVQAIHAEQSAGRWQVTAGGTNWNTSVVGVTPGYTDVRDWPLQSGVFFTDNDLQVNAEIAVLGASTATTLFGGSDAVGQTIQLRQAVTTGARGATARIVELQVVGVLEAKGTTFGFSRDDQILVPITTAQHELTGRLNVVSSINVKAVDAATMTTATAYVTDILLQRHDIADPANADFTVTNQNDTLSALSSVTGTFTLLLGAIGGITLMVGGIGIMNIMLVSVRERTREIGLRKAIGARRRDILLQFLIEAIALTGMGGVLGIALGWTTTEVIKTLPEAQSVVFVITLSTIAVAVGVSVLVGVVFGLYPALRAASLRPIEALRYE